RRLGLAPLAVEIDQQLLARGLHAILAEREARRRLALAQQRDAVAQALRELARVQVARLLRRAGRTAALRQAIGGEIDDERRDVLALGDRLRRDLELRGPALEQEGDERELALRELVRIGEAHQQSARVRHARRSVLHIAVQEVLD